MIDFDKLELEQCPCGHPTCEKVFIKGLTLDGRFERKDAKQVIRHLKHGQRMEDTLELVERARHFEMAKISVRDCLARLEE
jgi:hypothetical protein